MYVFCRDIVVPKSTVKTEESKSEDDDDDVFYDTEDDPDDADEDLNDSIVWVNHRRRAIRKFPGDSLTRW